MPIEIFYSYAHEDEPLRAKLETHLSLLERQGAITEWHDRAIGAGDEWRAQIDTHMRSAQIILLLISSDFIASDYCHDVEMRFALERHSKGEAIVIPVILRPVDWSGAAFAHLQALPRDARPITTWSNEDEAFRDIAQGIRRVVERFGAAGRGSPHAAALPRRDAPRSRVLDAAVPSHIVKNEATELQVLIRLPGSPGLRGVLLADDAADARPEDVSSREFKARFPLGVDGEPQALKAKVLLTSPEFDPPKQEKAIEIPPDGDSEVAAFLLTPQRLGRLKLLVELFWLDATWAPRRLLTECVAESSGVPPNAARHLVQLPLEIEAEAPDPSPLGPPSPARAVPVDVQAAPALAPPPRAGGLARKGGLASIAIGSIAIGSIAIVGIAGVVNGTLASSRPDPVSSLESCFETVFQSAQHEKRSGLVKATVAYLDGSIDTKAESERVTFYRALDDAELRLAISGCTREHGGKELNATAMVNVHSSNRPLSSAKVSVRNQFSQPVLTNTEGAASLSIQLGGVRTDTVPLAIEWRGAHFDVDARLSELELGKPIEVGKLGTLEISLVDPCNQRPIQAPASITLHLPAGSDARLWAAESPGSHDPAAPIRAETVGGVARFGYQGSLEMFDVGVRLADGASVTYDSQQASHDSLQLAVPRTCAPTVRPDEQARACPELERRVRGMLERRRGTRWTTVRITPTATGFECSRPLCDDLAELFSSELKRCRSFVVEVQSD